MAFRDDIQVNLNDLDELVSSNNNISSTYLEAKRKLCDIFHVQGESIKWVWFVHNEI